MIYVRMSHDMELTGVGGMLLVVESSSDCSIPYRSINIAGLWSCINLIVS